MHAHFLDAGLEGQILRARRALQRLSMRARSTPTSSGCRDELEGARELSRHPGAERQRECAREAAELAGLVAALADAF